MDTVKEDWGWWVAVEKQGIKMALGVYGVNEDTPKREFAVTVITKNTKKWIIWPFMAVSIESEIEDLKQNLASLLNDEASLIVADRTMDYPL